MLNWQGGKGAQYATEREHVVIEDAAIFQRIQAGNRTPGNALFQNGVHDEHGLWFDFKQNDEAGNLPRWEWCRKAMGFVREPA